MLVLILQLLAVVNILLNVPRVHVVHDRKRRALSNIKQRLAITIIVLNLVTILVQGDIDEIVAGLFEPNLIVIVDIGHKLKSSSAGSITQFIVKEL